MKVMRMMAALSALIPFMFAGCGKQSQQATPDSAHAVTQASALVPPSSARTTVQKAAPAFVFSTTLSAPKTAQTTNAIQGRAYEPSSQEDLPQADESVALKGTARTTLEAALSGAAGSGLVLLPDESAATLIDSLPEEFRNSCDAMVANWGENAKGKAKWTVRVLFSLRRPEQTEAVLALRCASTAQGQQDYYDERPAIVSLTPETATLKLIPMAPQENGDPTLYRLNFSQAFTALGAQLVELQVYHSTDNLCCGGVDEESGGRRVILDLSDGKQALSVDERTEVDSYDDSAEDADTHTICESKISYLRGTAGNVVSIATESRCTQNKEPLPEVKRQTFRWNAEVHRFNELQGIPQNK
jgi:hypothetical protein